MKHWNLDGRMWHIQQNFSLHKIFPVKEGAEDRGPTQKRPHALLLTTVNTRSEEDIESGRCATRF